MPEMPKEDELTERLNNAARKEEEESSFSGTHSAEAFVKALEFILSDKNIDQKTQLSSENIEGMIKLLTVNDYLKKHFGFRLIPYDTAIQIKIVKSISLDRQGKKELIELFKEMNLQIDATDIPSLGKRIIASKV
jgi:CRISPR/Cas system-associated exonuclease Cas4 (RecB family)